MKLILMMLLASPSISLADIKLGTREVVLNNEKVEVVRLTYPAGSESGMHTHNVKNIGDTEIVIVETEIKHK